MTRILSEKFREELKWRLELETHRCAHGHGVMVDDVDWAREPISES